MGTAIKGQISKTEDFKQAFEVLCTDLELDNRLEKRRCKADKGGFTHGKFNYFCGYLKLCVYFDYPNDSFTVWYPTDYKEEVKPPEKEVKNDEPDVDPFD